MEQIRTGRILTDRTDIGPASSVRSGRASGAGRPREQVQALPQDERNPARQGQAPGQARQDKAKPDQDKIGRSRIGRACMMGTGRHLGIGHRAVRPVQARPGVRPRAHRAARKEGPLRAHLPGSRQKGRSSVPTQPGQKRRKRFPGRALPGKLQNAVSHRARQPRRRGGRSSYSFQRSSCC